MMIPFVNIIPRITLDRLNFCFTSMFNYKLLFVQYICFQSESVHFYLNSILTIVRRKILKNDTFYKIKEDIFVIRIE